MTKPTTVWVNVCFDILHRGHLELLNYAATLADRLVVGIDSDQKVAADKGPSRPYNSARDRKYMLKSLRAVDTVVIFETPSKLTECKKNLGPDFMVVGSDWRGKTIVGGEYAKEIKFFDRVGDYSTTNILGNVR